MTIPVLSGVNIQGTRRDDDLYTIDAPNLVMCACLICNKLNAWRAGSSLLADAGLAATGYGYELQ